MRIGTEITLESMFNVLSLVSNEMFAILCNVKADIKRQTHILRLSSTNNVRFHNKTNHNLFQICTKISNIKLKTFIKTKVNKGRNE